MIYLDNASTTRVSPGVMSAMLPYFMEQYGNAGNIHSMGIEAAHAITRAREQVAKPIGADPDNIIFTSGGSEANTLAILGVLDHLKKIGKTHIITSSYEHHSVLETIKSTFHKGFTATYIDPDDHGYIYADAIEEKIQPDTGLVSIMGVNNETGTRNPISDIGRMCHKQGILFHTDCVQAYCMTPIDVMVDRIDFLSASGHKLYAPKGIGFLYAKNKAILRPCIYGSESQEYGLRGGTENVPYIVGFGAAVEEDHRDTWSYSRYYGLRQRLLGILDKNLSGWHVNGMPFYGSKIVNLRFDGVDGETLLLLLNSEGVIVSAGSACSAHEARPSHVLKALGLTDDQVRSSIRISFSAYTTVDEIDEAARIIIESVKKLRGEE